MLGVVMRFFLEWEKHGMLKAIIVMGTCHIPLFKPIECMAPRMNPIQFMDKNGFDLSVIGSSIVTNLQLL